MSTSPTFDEGELKRCYDAKVARYYEAPQLGFLEPCNYGVFKHNIKGKENEFIKDEQAINKKERLLRYEFKRCTTKQMFVQVENLLISLLFVKNGREVSKTSLIKKIEITKLKKGSPAMTKRNSYVVITK